MNTRPRLSLYNPQQDRIGDDAFVESFVARHEELELLLNELRAIADGGDSRHTVLIGARGMGKSSMLRRIAIAVERDEELLAAFMALSFREEQYNVISLDAFWRNCGEALAEWCDRHGRENLAETLDRAVASEEWREPEAAKDAFVAVCKEIGKRPVLLLDNLDIILDGLKDQASWLLRSTLQAEAGPIVVGGATHLMKQGGDRDAAFYEFFYPHYLEPLSDAEVLACMHALADRNAEAGTRVQDILKREPERVRTLNALSGGNPRILTLLYRVLQRAETDTIFADLEALLDEVTPFYKARIEEHQSPQQRAVIDAVALHWDPIGSRAISEVTGIEITTISSHLSRLKKSGFINEVESSGARSNYQLAERFMNIWYLMRHGNRRTRKRLRWLTLFLVRLFGRDEISDMANEIRSGGLARTWHRSYREAVLAADEMLLESSKSEERTEDFQFKEARARDDRVPSSAQPWDEVIDRALEALRRGSYEEALARLNNAFASLDDAQQIANEEPIASASCLKGLVLLHLGQPEEAITVFDKVSEHFGTTDAPAVQVQVAFALFNKGVTLTLLERPEDALAVYDEVTARYATSDAPGVQEGVARALINKGAALGRLERLEEQVAVYDEVEARFAATDAPAIQEKVAFALLQKGITLGQLERPEEEMAVYDEVYVRYVSSDAPSVQEKVARALVGKGLTLGQLERPEEEMAVYDEVCTRYSMSDAPSVQREVARALVNKGVALSRLERPEDALAVYDEVTARYATSEAPGVQEGIARALVNKGTTLGRLERLEEQVAVYDEVEARFAATDAPAIQEQVAFALLQKGITLGQLERPEEALAVLNEVSARSPTPSRSELELPIALAFAEKGRLFLDSLGNAQLAEAAYREALAVDSGDLFLRGNVAWAMLFQSREAESARERADLVELDAVGLALLDAGIEVVRQNFGLAAEHLAKALEQGLDPDGSPFFEDFLRFLRLAKMHGFDERLISWLEESGNHEKYAPVYVALVAFVRGERFLKDVNPETRASAQVFFDRLTAPDRAKVRGKPKRGGRRRK